MGETTLFHKDVDASEVRDRFGDKALEVISVGDIRLDHKHLATGIPDHLGGCQAPSNGGES